MGGPLEDISGKSEQAGRFVSQLMACQHQIYSFILTLVPNLSDADDLMQETAAVMWRKYETSEPISNFSAWGKMIARNKVLNYYTKRKNERLLFNDDLLHDVIEREERASRETAQRLKTLQSCITKLRENDRRLVQLLYERNITIKSLAERVQRPVQGLYKAMARIHNTLLLCMKRALPSEEVPR